ncbi:probable inactive ATP-dependent zinc metalloprotease FTSHI 5, chloroplastic [Zingiber officinale]|uniref:probable inactive ATP-dependent zinc metalloprotease FTSHI 5, chloroplastic n=1 Tax=Zingiber officinale TaxID=94328 RepID=UPI001C4B371F|nr:probable inactive ATP-dependent zinc metalloprotease FTSHI 5, chloroplastic [Zingiber officinale]
MESNTLTYNRTFPLLPPSSPFSRSRLPLPPTFLRSKPRRFLLRCGVRPVAALLPPLNPSVRSSTTAPTLQSEEKLQNLSRLYDALLCRIGKPLAFLFFCAAIGFLPVPTAGIHAFAANATVELKERRKTAREQKGATFKDHEFSQYTRRLLAAVSGLLHRIEEVESSKGDMAGVQEALKVVKEKRREVQEEVIRKLNMELEKLQREKAKLTKQSEDVMNSALADKKKLDAWLKKGGGGTRKRGNVQALENSLDAAENEYSDLSEKMSDIDDRISRWETLTYSIAIRELSFIERECELLVERFGRRLTQDSAESYCNMTHGLSRNDIRRDLETAQNDYWEQMLLPKVLEDEDPEIYSETDTVGFVSNIRQALRESRQMQENMESQLRRKLKKFGDEKRFLVRTSEDEVLKGFPEVELKWMFGQREFVVPKAVSLQLFHGWKKWREQAKENLKKDLLQNIDRGRQYMDKRKGRIIVDRERLMTKTWYNEERNRWEMDPVAVPFAISKNLIERAQIRHDCSVMYLTLKAEDRVYFVDLKEFDLLFEESGGFDGLYVKMLASGIPTAVQLMWIPFSELDIRQQFLLLIRLSSQCLVGLWKSPILGYIRERAYTNTRNIIDDLMIIMGFPLIEFIIPRQVRMSLGMAWPEESYQAVGDTWYLKWQSEAEINHRARAVNNIWWYFWFLIRSAVFGYLLFNVFFFLKRKIPRFLGYGPLRRDPNLKKLRRVKAYYNYARTRNIKRKKDGVDPITSAFEQMKRVKNPPIPLQDFSSVESMREEINDIVTCLRNPRAFQEKGARAPRGVLIVGERGTGKTSLALAIAAEARVPVVELKSRDLEAGLWVGQSASNIRELFHTARDLAPVIIFVEDFDQFAGVRGKFIHTQKQDHEAFINQLLVELDGFEKQDGVVLIATTTKLNKIDEALRRPGRMDRVLQLQRPTQMEREKILCFAAKDTMDDELIDFVDWKKVAEKTALLRPTELKLVPLALEASAFRNKVLDADELISYCSWFASLSEFVPTWLRLTTGFRRISKSLVDHLGLTLTKEDMESVVDLMEPYGQISNGIELYSPPLDWTRETKFPHAVWAAGCSLITLLLPNFDVVENVWLEPTAWEGIGCTKITKAKNEGSSNGNLESRSYLEKKLVFCFGSHVASQMLLPFGEENLLSIPELKQAQEICTQMVIQYGWSPNDSPAIYITRKEVGGLSMGNNHQLELAEKIEQIYDLAYDKAKEMLWKNHKLLETIVEQLLIHENLTGEDLQKIFKDNGGIQEKEPFFLSKQILKEIKPGKYLDERENAQVLDLLELRV